MAETKERPAPVKKPDTRAVTRLVEPATGTDPVTCPHCGNPVKFRARQKDKKVVANVYRGRKGHRVWDRVEHFHEACYEEAGEPYGPAEYGKPEWHR